MKPALITIGIAIALVFVVAMISIKMTENQAAQMGLSSSVAE